MVRVNQFVGEQLQACILICLPYRRDVAARFVNVSAMLFCLKDSIFDFVRLLVEILLVAPVVFLSLILCFVFGFDVLFVSPFDTQQRNVPLPVS